MVGTANLRGIWKLIMSLVIAIKKTDAGNNWLIVLPTHVAALHVAQIIWEASPGADITVKEFRSLKEVLDWTAQYVSDKV